MENPAILLRRLNPYCARAMEGAASLCQTRAHAEILPEHWLLKLLEQGEGDLTVLARRYEWDMDALWQDLLGWLDNQPRSVRSRPQLSADIQKLLQEAWMQASLAGEESIRSQHLLMALTENPRLARCDGLWPLLTLGQSQLERLRPLLDAQSDERPEVQQEAELAKSHGGEVEFVGRPVGAEVKEGELTPALQNALDKFTLDVTAKRKRARLTRYSVATLKSARWLTFSRGVAKTIRSWSVNRASAKPRWWKAWRYESLRVTCRNRSSLLYCAPLTSACCRQGLA